MQIDVTESSDAVAAGEDTMSDLLGIKRGTNQRATPWTLEHEERYKASPLNVAADLWARHPFVNYKCSWWSMPSFTDKEVGQISAVRRV